MQPVLLCTPTQCGLPIALRLLTLRKYKKLFFCFIILYVSERFDLIYYSEGNIFRATGQSYVTFTLVQGMNYVPANLCCQHYEREIETNCACITASGFCLYFRYRCLRLATLMMSKVIVRGRFNTHTECLCVYVMVYYVATIESLK